MLLGGSVGIEFPAYGGVDVGYLADERARMGMAQLYSSIAPDYLSGKDVMSEPFLSMRQQFRLIMEAPLKTDSVW